MTQTMKALAKTRPAEGLELIDAPVPEAGPEDVLIRVQRARPSAAPTSTSGTGTSGLKRMCPSP